MPELLCECGHTRAYHVQGDDWDDGWTGHYCEYQDCECMDFVPGVDQGEDADER